MDDRDRIAARIIANLARTLDAGFTTAREMGGLDGGFAQAVAAGLVPGARLFPSGPLLCSTAGHGDLSPSFPPHPTHSHDGSDAMLAYAVGAAERQGVATGRLVADMTAFQVADRFNAATKPMSRFGEYSTMPV